MYEFTHILVTESEDPTCCSGVEPSLGYKPGRAVEAGSEPVGHAIRLA